MNWPDDLFQFRYEMGSWRRPSCRWAGLGPLLPLLGIALLAFAAYANILNNRLFLDDLDYIVNNAFIRDWRYWTHYFTDNLIAGSGKTSDYYRPAILVAFAAGHSCWELNPMGYHLLSIAFHALNGILLFVLLEDLWGMAGLPLAIALLFILHPVQTEAVASASALGILMGMFFVLLLLVLHLRLRRNWPDGAPLSSVSWTPGMRVKSGILALCGILALLSKETWVVLPGAVFLVEFWFILGTEPIPSRFRRALLVSLPYLALSLLYLGARLTFLNFGGTTNLFRAENVFTQSFLARLYTFFSVFLEFFKVFLWPHPLFMERATSLPIYLNFWHGPVVTGFLLLAFCLGGVALALRREGTEKILARTGLSGMPLEDLDWALRLTGFGILWFLFGLVPVSNLFIPISTLMVESWLYGPAIGLMIAVGGWAWVFLKRADRSARSFCLIAGGGLLALYFWKVHSQNKVWKTPISFYEHTLTHAPQSARFRNNLAMAYADEKRYPEAIQQYVLAIQLNDQYPETHHNLANSLAALGRAQEAESQYWQAIRKDPRFYHSYLSLASLYLDSKRPDLTKSVLERLIVNAPDRWEGYFNLGMLHFVSGNAAMAQSLWQEGLRVDPFNASIREAMNRLPADLLQNKEVVP